MIIETIPVGVTQTNCYVLGSREREDGIVIDPGAEPETILEVIGRRGLTIQYVLNTHGHFDHIGANADIVEATGARLGIHASDLPLLRLDGGAALFGLPVRKSPEPDVLLEHGQLLEVGLLKLEVLHTPGHSPGGITLYMVDHGVAFDGDLLFAGGVGRADLPGGSWETIRTSVESVLFALPGRTILYPGHGPETTVAHERRTNPWFA